MTRKILLVDSSSEGRKETVQMLTDEYEIIEAENTQKAISMMYKEYRTLSAVLIDINIPVTDDFELLKKKHNNSILAPIPTILIIGDNNKETQIKAIEMGADDFVLKDYPRQVILHCLNRNIEKYENTQYINFLQFDNLTGIYRREPFLDEAEKMIRLKPSGYYVISCLDIDNFKIINDQYSTGTGDKVLKHVADCIYSGVAAIDGICCRVAADDFAILYPAEYMDSDLITENHYESTKPKCINRKISICIGRYIINDIDMPVSVMLDRAAMAVKSIKGKYGIYIAQYNDCMRSELIREQQIVNSMYDALECGQFEPWFQPQYNHATGAMIGAEALVRWKKNGSFIPPSSFVPIFERNGFIYQMDQYIWEQTCKYLRKWMDNGYSPLPVSVNISRRDLFHHHFVEVLTNIVNKYSIPYDLIRLEVTESAFSDSTKQIVSKVVELINMGFTVEIDDFGSGYSSLNTLKDVPASILKLDMKFFEDATNSQRSGNIIESVIRMAKWLGMAVIAEGVEEKAQADYLKSIGCYYIQGYYYAKPMPVNEYERLLTNKNKEPQLTRLKTLDNLNNNEFWNPKSMETLIFNSYVGGACIFEYYNGNVEIIRCNDQFANELGYFKSDNLSLSYLSNNPLFDDKNHEKALKNIINAIETNKESSCELQLSDKDHEHTEYIRTTVRVIASTGERYMLYNVIVNITDQRLAEQKQHEAEQKEMESAQQLHFIMSNINGGVSAFTMDQSGKMDLIFSNESYFSLYGYTQKEAEEENIDVMSLIVPEDFKYVMECINKLKVDGKPAIIDYRCWKRDGRIAYLRANVSLTWMESYGANVITSVLTDITEQKELSEQLKAIINNINGGVTVTILKKEGPEFVIVNNRYYELLGYTKQQYKTECKDKYACIHPDDKKRVAEMFRESAMSHKRHTLEYRIIRRDGAIRYLQVNTSVINIFGIDEPVQLAVTNDITGIRETEIKESATADKLRAVLNNAGNGVTASIIHGNKTELLFANDKYYEIVGYTRNEFENNIENAISLIHPDDREKVYSVAREASRTHKDTTVQYRVIHPDGKIVWIKTVITITNLISIDSPVQIAVFSDITAEVEATSQLRFMNDSAHDILSQPNFETALNKTLSKILSYFMGDRVYIIEINYPKNTLAGTYEVCADGISSENINFNNISFDKSGFWLKLLKKDGLLYINNLRDIAEINSDVLHLFEIRKTHSIILAPLWRDGIIIGFVGIDNPSKTINHPECLIGISDYIAILLTRRDVNYKIRKDEEIMHQLVNDTPGGFCKIISYNNSRPKFVYVNKGFCKILKMTEEEVMKAYGDDAYKCFKEEDITASSSDSANAFYSGHQFTSKCRLLRKDGTYVWCIVSGRFIKDEPGVLYMNAYFTDITKQTKAEQLQKRLLDNLPCGAALFEYEDHNLSVVHINTKYWQLVGRKKINYKNASVFDMIHPDDRATVHKELDEAIDQNRNISCNARIRYGESDYHMFHIHATVAQCSENKYTLYVSFISMTEQIMSVKGILPVALSTMMSVSEEISYLKDINLHYICCSRSAADRLGLKNEKDVIGMTDYELFDKKTADKFIAEERKIIESGQSVIDSIGNISKESNHICIANTSKYPIKDSFGNVIGIYGISRDITAEKENESQLELLTNSIPCGLASYAVTENGVKAIYFNDGFIRFSGYSRDEYFKITQNDPFALMYDEDKIKISQLINEVSTTKNDGEITSFLYRRHTKSGGTRWMNLKSRLSKLSGEHCIFNVVQFDITEQKEIEENLRIAEEEYRTVTYHSGRNICHYNIREQTLKIAPGSVLPMPEYISDVPYGRVKLGLISEDTADAYISFFEKIINGQKEGNATFKRLFPSGWRWLNAYFTTIYSEDGKPFSAIISYIDVTEQNEKDIIYRKWQQSLSNRPDNSYTLFRCDLSKNSACDFSEGTLIDYDHDIYSYMTFNEYSIRYADTHVLKEDRQKYVNSLNVDKLIEDFKNNKHSFSLEFREIIKPDSSRWIQMSVDLVESPNSKSITAYIMYENIDERKRNELLTIRRSETDPLTGVLNRTAFEIQVNQIIKESKSGENHALMMLDVDNFKRINDVLGHTTGDQTLIDVTNNIRYALRRSDLIGRLGGDEFVVFLINIPLNHVTPEKAKKLCDITRKTLSEDIKLSVSIGISVYPNDGNSFEELYKKADKALYYVKDNDKDNYAFYNEQL